MITKHPLVLNITNSVTIDFVANALLAVGASPVMSEDPQDAHDLAGFSQGICLNIGTIHEKQWQVMEKVLQVSGDKSFVLDPVGSGATRLRTDTSVRILESGRINLIRGNASEISSLVGASQTTKGVDSTMESLSVKDSALRLAEKYKTMVVVSGEVDLVTDGKQLYRIYNGSALMPRITGTGCVLSAFLAAVLGDGQTDTGSIAKAVAFYGYMGEIAEKLVQGAGSFKVRFLDALSQIRIGEVEKYLKIESGEA